MKYEKQAYECQACGFKAAQDILDDDQLCMGCSSGVKSGNVTKCVSCGLWIESNTDVCRHCKKEQN